MGFVRMYVGHLESKERLRVQPAHTKTPQICLSFRCVLNTMSIKHPKTDNSVFVAEINSVSWTNVIKFSEIPTQLDI